MTKLSRLVALEEFFLCNPYPAVLNELMDG